ARVEAIIRRALEKGKAVVGEEPQMQIGGSVSEILELVAPKKLMIFELKWPTEVLDIKQALPEVEEEEETPVGVVNTVVLRKSATEASYNLRINNDTTILTLVTNCEKRVRKWIREKVSSVSGAVHHGILL
ncbi:cyclin-D1-1, partial [Trifolium medium]|nr:cyclin-D1-1 [Trifolium medium]